MIMHDLGKIVFLKPLLLVFFTFFFMLSGGCASFKGMEYSSDTLEEKLAEGDLRQKTDRLLVVIDGQRDINLKKAYGLLQGIKESIPSGISYEKAFRIYGWNVKSFSEDISILFGLHKLTHQGIEELVVTKTLPDSEINPLSISLDSLVMELSKTKGNNALVIISNGRQINDSTVKSARYLKQSLAEQICFYPVLMGDDPEGEKRLQTLTEIGGCGYLSRGEALLSADEMADFVCDMFFLPVEPLPCKRVKKPAPEKKTPSLEKMLGRDKKISFVLNVEFEFDKAEVRPEFHNELKKTAEFLKTYPQTAAELIGHTDSIGSESYNRRLSLQRARSVRTYLIDKFNIDEERLTVKGVGEAEPVADNSSATGRQRNRRLVAVITRQVKEFRPASAPPFSRSQFHE
ncbi:MAG: OmpA family protein [Desulfobia sp.]